MSYRIEVRGGEWAGSLHQGWAPAVAGTLNQTGASDEVASTFDSWDVASSVLDDVILPEAFGNLDDDEDESDLEFRILEL